MKCTKERVKGILNGSGKEVRNGREEEGEKREGVGRHCVTKAQIIRIFQESA